MFMAKKLSMMVKIIIFCVSFRATYFLYEGTIVEGILSFSLLYHLSLKGVMFENNLLKVENNKSNFIDKLGKFSKGVLEFLIVPLTMGVIIAFVVVNIYFLSRNIFLSSNIEVIFNIFKISLFLILAMSVLQLALRKIKIIKKGSILGDYYLIELIFTGFLIAIFKEKAIRKIKENKNGSELRSEEDFDRWMAECYEYNMSDIPESNIEDIPVLTEEEDYMVEQAIDNIFDIF